MYNDCPSFVKDFLAYMETIKGRSPTTVKAYYTDLKTFFRFILKHKHLCDEKMEFEQISIEQVTIEIVQTITLSDIYEFLLYTSSNRANQSNTRARKVSCLRVFFRYLTNNRALLKENPVENLESPSIKKTLPKYLSLEDCFELLNHIDGSYQERDYCIIVLFLNCGMRLSELVGINLNDIHKDTLLIRGKGNKERIVYLNDACLSSIERYLTVRNHQIAKIKPQAKEALFISKTGSRLSKRRIEELLEEYLKKAGLSGRGYSVHKLRHTAATIMYQHGGVDIRVLQEILGHTNLGTTQIYTHVSNEQMKQAMQHTPLSRIKQKDTQIK